MIQGSALLNVAKTAALEAGRVLMGSYGRLRTSQIRSKAKNDFVTDLDRRSEKIILRHIRRHFPSHGIMAEESGQHSGREYVWAVDPLDGTANYIHQFPMFSVSIGILRDGIPYAGVIYDPLHKELFFAEKAQGAFLNDRRIRASRTPVIAQALLTTGIPFRGPKRFSPFMRSFESISMASAGMRRGGSAALDLAYVACGRLDGYWEIGLSVWDIAAGAAIVREAGGEVTDLWGCSNYLKTGDIAATCGKGVHRGLLAITRKTVPRGERE